MSILTADGIAETVAELRGYLAGSPGYVGQDREILTLATNALADAAATLRLLDRRPPAGKRAATGVCRRCQTAVPLVELVARVTDDSTLILTCPCGARIGEVNLAAITDEFVVNREPMEAELVETIGRRRLRSRRPTVKPCA